MAGYQVAAELAPELQRLLEIDPGARTPAGGGGERQRLCRRVDVERGALIRLAGRHNGQADSRTGDRGADRDRLACITAADGDALEPLRLGLKGEHLADIGDDPGEHDQS